MEAKIAWVKRDDVYKPKLKGEFGYSGSLFGQFDPFG